MKPTICSAPNTVVPALLVLRAKGFHVYRTKIVGHDEDWVAETGDIKFIAEDLVTLLGLQAMYEYRQPNWKALDTEIDEYFVEFPD